MITKIINIKFSLFALKFQSLINASNFTLKLQFLEFDHNEGNNIIEAMLKNKQNFYMYFM